MKLPRHYSTFLGQILEQKNLVLSLAKREVVGRYTGSLLGAMWTFIHPLVLIFVFWFVFSVGFKAKPLNDIPFVVWLTAGMTPWFLFAEIFSGATGSVVDNGNLIKKTVFPSQILPVVRVFASLVTHVIFLVLLTGLLFFQQIGLSWWALQFVYYLACLCILTLGAGWMSSALNVFFRDVSHLVGVILQVGFWMTPIFWDISIMPPKIQFLLKCNPIYYIVQGYRDCFIYHVGFWQYPYQTLYFWVICLLCFGFGVFVFSRLKPIFADVL